MGRFADFFIYIVFCIMNLFQPQNNKKDITVDRTQELELLECYIEEETSIKKNEKIIIQINTSAEDEYVILFDYLLPDVPEETAIKIIVDNHYLVSQKLPKSETINSILANNSISLSKGNHSISFNCVFGEVFLTKITLVPINEEYRKKIAPPSNLCIPFPSEATLDLYHKLCLLRGCGILSGQQIYNDDLSPIIAINSVTEGSNPVILGIDLINYSPSRVERGLNAGKTIDTAINWHKEGGIITCAWHWNAPANLLDLDEQNKHWYEGYVTGSNTFDFPKGLDNETSVEYFLLIRDIDAIAEQLKKLQNADVPVLWRPLHEASGGWFWWGTKKAEYYIKLYKLLYERLVYYHKLNNLIWVWNGQSPSWYPGDEYVDIISYDEYSGEHIHTSVEDKLSLIQSATCQAKLCAISENGSLPDINKLSNTKSIWSWFCTWFGDFVVEYNSVKYSEKYTSEELFSQWYKTDWLITREEYIDLFRNND